MKSQNDITNHIDALMQQAENPARVDVSSDFERNLNFKIDSLAQKRAPIFNLNNVFRYAALFLLVLLNISAVLFLRNSAQQEIDTEVAEHVDEYFPDYTLLTSLE